VAFDDAVWEVARWIGDVAGGVGEAVANTSRTEEER